MTTRLILVHNLKPLLSLPMADARQSKKRKRDENESKTVLQVSDGSAGTGPVVGMLSIFCL